MTARTFTERDIHLALDGELPDDEIAAFTDWVDANPAMKAVRDRLAADRDLLRRTFGPIVDEPIPSRLAALAESSASGNEAAMRPWWRLVAAAMLLAAGGAAGYAYASLGVGETRAVARVADNAVEAHEVYAAEKLHVVEVGADQKDHLVGWLSKRVGTKLVAPDLADQGYSLVGGRLLPAAGQAAAQFMYQDHAGNRVSLYVTHGARKTETGFRLYEQDPARAFYWLDGGFAYAVAGEVPEDKLLAIANASYRQLLAAQGRTGSEGY